MDRDSFYSRGELEQMGFKTLGKTDVLVSRKASIYGASNISLESNVRIDDFCILSGNITIGRYVHIAAYSALFGGKEGILLKDFSGLSSRCVIYASSDDYSGNSLTNPTVPEIYTNIISGKVILEKHVIVGTGSSIMPGIIIGEGAAIGSMSLVNKSVEAWGIYVGIPCKKVKNRSQKILELEEDLWKEMITKEEE